MSADPLYTVEEFAAVVRLHPKTIYALIAKGKLPGVVRIGRSVRILRAQACGVVSPPEAAGLPNGEQP
jgi:excisionase family DNA binding protein